MESLLQWLSRYRRSIVGLALLFILLAVIAWLYKSAVNEKMNKSLWPILGIFFNVFAVCTALCSSAENSENESASAFPNSVSNTRAAETALNTALFATLG